MKVILSLAVICLFAISCEKNLTAPGEPTQYKVDLFLLDLNDDQNQLVNLTEQSGSQCIESYWSPTGETIIAIEQENPSFNNYDDRTASLLFPNNPGECIQLVCTGATSAPIWKPDGTLFNCLNENIYITIDIKGNVVDQTDFPFTEPRWFHRAGAFMNETFQYWGYDMDLDKISGFNMTQKELITEIDEDCNLKLVTASKDYLIFIRSDISTGSYDDELFYYDINTKTSHNLEFPTHALGQQEFIWSPDNSVAAFYWYSNTDIFDPEFTTNISFVDTQERNLTEINTPSKKGKIIGSDIEWHPNSESVYVAWFVSSLDSRFQENFTIEIEQYSIFTGELISNETRSVDLDYQDYDNDEFYIFHNFQLIDLSPTLDKVALKLNIPID